MFKPVQFGKYYLTERIAVGGMAEIFKAKLYGVSGFEKPMVVKQILPQYARNAEFIKMFIDEAKIAVSLTHGNIIPVYELGRIDGVYFIAMEYVHGKNLGEILESARDRRMQLSIDDAVYIAIETCKGLDYAHRRTDAQGSSLGLVHRDISPPNVMVSMTGEVKLADFGIAKATHKLGNTEAGVVKGTYGYMSPEQLLGDVVDHRTDIFSCGILLYEMLTGRRLFGGGSELEAMERVKEARVQAPSTMSSRVPSALDPIVARALAKDPADRYATANEFQLELSRFLFSSGAGASATTLTGFINRLFPSNEAANEPLMPEEPPPPNPAVSNRTQSYAVRDVLEEVDRQQQHQPQRTAGAGLASDRTMGLPALAPAEGLAPLDIESEAFDELAEDEKTNVFRRDEPQKPEVPELRFSAPAAGRGKQPAGGLFDDDEVSAALDSLDSAVDFGDGSGGSQPQPMRQAAAAASPADEFTGPRARSAPSAAGAGAAGLAPSPRPAPAAADAPPSLADLLEPGGDLGGFGSERAAPPAATQPSNGSNGASGASEAMTSREIAMSVEGPGDMDLPSQQAPPKKQKKRPTLSSDDGLMALMAAGGNTGQVPAVQEGSGVRKRPSGMFSSTMRFFVEGLDEEDEMALVDGPPRTVKPTVIGWVVILAIVLGAVAFVVYKKTSLFGGSAPGSGDEAKLDPNKKGSGSGSATKAAPKVKRGSIALVSAPDGAYFFLHLGDSPVTTKVDSGQNIVVRAERGSYGTVHKTVTAAELASGKAVVKLVLTPAAAAAAATAKNAHVLPPELPAAGTKTGKLVDLKIETDPPTSSVWLFVGKGKAELKDVEAKRHFFKALLAGHETSLITVLGSEIEGKSITRTAKFAGAGTGSGSGSGSASASAGSGSGSSSGDAAGSAAATAGASGGSGSGSAAAATPPPAKKAVPRRRKRPRRAVVPRVRRTPRRRPRRKKKKKKKKPGLTLPSWAK